ncbi:hypothetical protein [Hyphomicrobium sp.]|uniref:hypothetical protein n=1 Tax=Hyphomicrobium sp. TaxID=82 RepID=UPI002E2F2242|nr:hypothetical protein [Hyphomicrobium sp.]HEX2842402.1 hypothetical protein [Hyphomicrobium sp.]
MRITRIFLLLAPAVLAAPQAVAAPLDPPACTALKTEYDGLIAAGAKADMDRGPEWAKTNLAPDRLGKIERLIAIEEQLSFRCGEQLTARPAIKELPKPPQTAGADPDQPTAKLNGNATGGGTPSNIPPPKRKNKSAASKQ